MPQLDQVIDRFANAYIEILGDHAQGVTAGLPNIPIHHDCGDLMPDQLGQPLVGHATRHKEDAVDLLVRERLEQERTGELDVPRFS